jgi:UDP-hydrolysing UDP-N-acetyl-D-glucosamine 2-epimerase
MKILLINGSRSDWGGIREVVQELTGKHALYTLSSPTPFGSDTRYSAAKFATQFAASVYGRIADFNPDLVILSGDRYEVLAAATATAIMGKPIAHLGGGDITEGSQDDSYRHAISKLVHLHFVSCKEAANVLLQMGEESWRVHVTGDPEIDTLVNQPLYTREAALGELGIPHDRDFVLVTYHPNTLGDTECELKELLKAAMTLLRSHVKVIFTKPNQDPGYQRVIDAFKALGGAVYYDAPARINFLSLLKHANAFIGNSSAGFYEAPTFDTPVINIGNRQKGRLKADCIVNCQTADQIIEAYARFQGWVRSPYNPYGDGHSAPRIAKIIEETDLSKLLLKRFCAWPSTKSGKPFIPAVTGVATQMSTSSGMYAGVLGNPKHDFLT